jgi:hypothetical protein
MAGTATVRLGLGVMATVLLAGCSGYMVDRIKPKSALVAPQLGRYGISGPSAECVEQRLTKDLTTWQLRQLYNLASGLTTGGQGNPTSLRPSDFVYVAGLVKDAEVGARVREALAGCNVTTNPIQIAPPPTLPAGPVEEAPSRPAPPAGAAPSIPPALPTEAEPAALWVNLGAAASGQGIAVDARSVTRIEGLRQAWFRLLRIDGNAIVGETGYLLRVDCAAKTITAHAGRTYGRGGALLQQKDYDKPEGPLAIEQGTVIEVAFHALCDDAG